LEPPCDKCYVELDEHNAEVWNIYLLVRDQVRMTSMGDIIGLDHVAVLDIIKLYVATDNVKETFEHVLECFNIERELTKN